MFRKIAWTVIGLVGIAGIAPLHGQEGVSTLGDARTRHLAALGVLPAPGDVIVEDFVNYHRHALPAPRAGEALALDLRWGGSRDPRSGDLVLQIGLATPELHDRRELPRLRLALVVDRSGSMRDAGKLDQVKKALHRFVKKLRSQDEVALIAYSTEAVVLRSLQAVGDGAAFGNLIDSLTPDANTNLHAGLMLGLRELDQVENAGGARRVILLTDGIANQGVTEPEAIARDAASYLERGIDVATIGVGNDLQRDLLMTLAQRGRGLAHFIGDAADIEKVFEAEFQSLVAPAVREVIVDIALPRGTQIGQIYGYQPERTERGVRIALPDLSFGATLVIMVRIKDQFSAEISTEAISTRVRYRDVAKDSKQVLVLEAPGQPTTGDSLADPSVRKNYAIARLAYGLHTMAAAASQQQWATAEQRLDEPLRFVERLFPGGDDPDLKRVLETAHRCRKIVRHHLEGDGL